MDYSVQKPRQVQVVVKGSGNDSLRTPGLAKVESHCCNLFSDFPVTPCQLKSPESAILLQVYRKVSNLRTSRGTSRRQSFMLLCEVAPMYCISSLFPTSIMAHWPIRKAFVHVQQVQSILFRRWCKMFALPVSISFAFLKHYYFAMAP